MNSEMENFETERLYLRPTNKEDADFILELMNTPKWMKFIGDRNVKSKEAAEAYIENKIWVQHKRLGFSNYTVIRKSDGVKMGSCGLYDREGLEGVDIGFAFLPQYEGQGYGFEASQKILALAFDRFGLKKVVAITDKRNVVSQSLLKKLGLIFAGEITLEGDDKKLFLFEKRNDISS
ncbi:GNAT family N-acetyltransferase [Namhaeicola litoreus]|uniref:GNAT family N-acetyltransferase n=1 Tax=Namhaeicola litoreus TaxID=1052145 RepID=A0ABW3Y013_9FLAO